MKELLFTLCVLYMIRILNLSGWWDIPIILIFLFIDYRLLQNNIKNSAELEAMKIFLNKK